MWRTSIFSFPPPAAAEMIFHMLTQDGYLPSSASRSAFGQHQQLDEYEFESQARTSRIGVFGVDSSFTPISAAITKLHRFR
jgi:hypothetical protein